jgi:D-ribulokinase
MPGRVPSPSCPPLVAPCGACPLGSTGVHPIVTHSPAPGHYVQSSRGIWAAVGAAVRLAMTAAGAAPSDVRGVGFDATCSLVVEGPWGPGDQVVLGGHAPPTRGPHATDADVGDADVGDADGGVFDVIVWMDHRAQAGG